MFDFSTADSAEARDYDLMGVVACGNFASSLLILRSMRFHSRVAKNGKTVERARAFMRENVTSSVFKNA